MTRPSFVDNRDGNTLANAINEYLAELDETLADDPDLDIATGYFNPAGYFSVRERLDEVGRMRLLIGAQPEQPDREEYREPSEKTADEYERERVESALQSVDENLERDRNLLGFSRNTDENLKDLVAFLRDDDVEVRRYEDGFIHGKAYLFSDGQGVVAGSSNFTGAGLNYNLELNLGQYQPDVTNRVEDWFDDLWTESVPYDLAGLYEERFQPYDPYLIYLRVLYERYGDELEAEETDGDGIIELANFQEDGARRARRFIEEYNGVIVADEVGLGKTYIGGKLLEETVNDWRQRALVIAPAYLRDGLWKRVRADWNFYFDVVSYSQLRNDRQLGGDGHHLEYELDEYQLVVIDEGHAFRNPGTQQSEALRQLLRGDPPKDVAMLTATPINNSLLDLYYLLTYFVKNDAAFASDGIRSLRERFKSAQREDPSELSPDALFDVLDQTTVRRTRRFIKDHYQNAMLPDGEGGEIRIRFPDPIPVRVDYTFGDTFGDDYFEDIATGLAAGEDDDDPELTLARYRPSFYRLDEEEDAAELSFVGLLRTGLLKRFESSSRAFATSLDRMIRQNRAALELLDEGYFPATEAIEEWVETDSDEALEEAFAEAEGDSLNLSEIAVDEEQLRADLESDIDILERWYEGAAAVDRSQDEKLDALRNALRDVVERAREDATRPGSEGDIDESQFRQNRKVLLFSYFEDTVDWIYEYLDEIVAEDDVLSCYEGRIAAASGRDVKFDVSRDDAVFGFAPESTDAPGAAEDRFDILIATDVLGQGANLQQARNVVNYDLPWNPMRVVQRNGRIDRVDTDHRQIYPHTFFPEDRLDELLELERRVRRKLTQVARSLGIDNEVIPGMETVDRNFADRVEDIEEIHGESSEFYEQSGSDAAAYSGEEYRQELREGLERRGESIRSLPWGSGSGLRGDDPGYFFCARIGQDVFMRFVPVNVEIDSDAELVTDTLACLRRIECVTDTDRVVPDDFGEGVYDAWTVAKEDIYEQWDEQTDPKNVQPDIRRLFREVGQHLRDHWPDDLTQEKLEETVASVEAPWGRRYERELREVFEADGDEPVETSRRLIDKIEELGLQPFEAPDPLPPIDEEQIKLVCWMVVAPSEVDDPDAIGGLLSQTSIS